MIPGLSGRLISSAFAADVLPDLSGIREPPAHVARACSRWNAVREAELGPASSVRAICDVAAVPLMELLGYGVVARSDAGSRCDLLLSAGTLAVPAVVAPWSYSLDAVWRDAVRTGIAFDARWCICTNGRALRIVDTHRTWSRSFVDLDLKAAAHSPDTLRILWTIARAEAMSGPGPLLDRVVELSSSHGTAVCRALADGVLEALRLVVHALARTRRRPDLPALLEQSLTVLYRVLFLLFAEARGLVPVWHAVYRDRYTIESIVSTLMAGRRHRGTWQAIRAIARLAHAGCRAGDLRVTAFNGRLFSPLHTPSAERGRIADATIGRALVAVGTAPGRSGRTRIRYRDLDVEQLGAVYEHVLDYEAARQDGTVALRRTGDARKATGTFYTPRPVTAYVVRRTLGPLVHHRTAAEILRLRIVDPAMGSGAFLVAACRYLAEAVEAALLRDGEWLPDDATPDARATLRREVAQRCLFGVDLNPTAVQLARLSLWLATLAADRPLTFLDHRLATGDSLVGASLADVFTRAPGRPSKRRSHGSLPLFDAEALGDALRAAVDVRLRVALERDDDVQVVRKKETALARLCGHGSSFMRWKALADLWCACWFWDDPARPTPPLFTALSDALLRGESPLPPEVARAWLDRAREVAAGRRFLHWELEFPEVFFDAAGRRHAHGGFDAVLGNPPWDMVRGDSGEGAMREDRRADARQLVAFVRGSGRCAASGAAHVNRYQLFVERALDLARPGARIGLVLPAGIVSDAGSAPLRRHLFDRAAVDTLVGLDNRAGVFPIHRSIRFVLLTATAGGPTERTSCRFGVSDPDELEAIDDATTAPTGFPVTLSRAFLARVSGDDDLAIPELATPMDVRIVERITAAHAWLSAPDGWNARFGRELNASDDRGALSPASGARGARPVLEGKQIAPFRAALAASRLEVSAAAAFTVRVPRRARLAYRDVASATNRLTLIAAIVPARAVTTHTLFCLRTPMPRDRQQTLCALLNSFVANYLVRLRVNTHVTIAITSKLPVPHLAETDPAAVRLAGLAEALSEGREPVERMAEYVDLQALAARVYGLSAEELAHVLGTFPLIPSSLREAVLARFEGLR